ncbi:MAG: Uma2 family endonuclease [Anaerolineae bacterium]
MALPEQFIPEAAYLALERDSSTKHEYGQGQVFAMTGASASLEHNLIVGNTVTTLNNQLAESPCIVSPSDMRVKIPAARAYRYPDVSVVCAPPEMEDGSLLNPVVLIEVPSPSTALVDRNQKLREYRQIDKLQEYVLISPDEPRIERFLRQPEDNWLYTEVVSLENKLELPSIACHLALADVYRKVAFGVNP